jgi:AraC-like DNA-binding protein/mannose-6-phosphate isomerase-like protein (cupin superfamily)
MGVFLLNGPDFMVAGGARLSLKCQEMSKKRQATRKTRRGASDGVCVRTFAVRHTHDYVIPPHAHDWHQLIYASEGVMWVQSAQGDWVVPPNRAVWVPACVEHSIEMTGSVFVQTVYLMSTLYGTLPDRCCAVNVSPFLRELIRHVVSLGMLDENDPPRARLIGVLLDQLSVLPTIPLQLPWPADERARNAGAWLRAHPADPGATHDVAKRFGLSVRTMERLFQRGTGLTFGKWRQQLRLLQALRLLAAGRPVTEVALDVGYESPSAFIAMFRRTLGVTPYRYFASNPASGRS